MLIYFTFFFYTFLKSACVLHLRHILTSTRHVLSPQDVLQPAPLDSTGPDTSPPPSRPPAVICGTACANFISMSFHFCLYFSHFNRLTYLFGYYAICSWNMSAYLKMRSVVSYNLSNCRYLIWWSE